MASEFEPKFKNLVDLVETSVKAFGPNPLFGTKKGEIWEWTTYAELGTMIDELRGGLASLGIGEGDKVAAISNNRVEWAMAAYATYGLQAAFVPMYEAQLDKEWKFIIADCGAKAVIVSSKVIYDRVKRFQSEIPTLEHVLVMEGSGDDSFEALRKKGREKPVASVHPDPKATAGLIYTSGTTGNPKGVVLTHANLASNVSAMQEIIPFSANDRSLSFLPWAHSFGQTVELHGMISVGASMGLAESTEKIVANLGEVQPTILMSVPRIFNKIYDGVNKQMTEKGGLIEKVFKVGMRAATKQKKHEPLSFGEGISLWFARKVIFSKIIAKFGGRLQYAVSGGAALNRDVAEFIDNLGITVYEGYGLTETSPIATANTQAARRIGSVGKPIPGVRIEIDTVASGDAKQGEIVVLGHNVMAGYHNLPEENAKVLREDGGFRTGDLGYLDDDGFLWITGRIKEQYKLENGKYVSPAHLEEQLQLSPYIMQAVVHGANKPYNIALIVPDAAAIKSWAEKEGIDTSKLMEDDRVKALLQSEIEACSKEFKSFEKVQRFAIVEEEFTTANDMLTPSLKLRRRNVLAKYDKLIGGLYTEKSKSSSAAATA
ncbi:MAG: long-chain fatty acid--CoA ligase [Deltaproteobacteria bacterium]|nr:long-chain fatty acid--CoA ligase [Deltaproteobacteria bacterium]